MSQTVQQLRAAQALAKVRQICADHKDKDGEKWLTEFKVKAKAFPADIRMLGLGTALALARGANTGSAARKLYELLAAWLIAEGRPYATYRDAKSGQVQCDDVLDGLIKSGQDQYFAAQAEAMLFMDWVKKFANALIETKHPAKPDAPLEKEVEQ